MFARVVTFNVGPGGRATVQALAENLAPQIRAMEGCEVVTFYADDTDGEGGIFVLWRSREAAEAASAVIGPQLAQAMSGAQRKPVPRLFDVLDA